MPHTLFETRRLCVRRIEAEDVDAMHSVYGDAEAMRWVGDGQPLSRLRCEEWLVVTQRNYETRGYGMCAIVELQSQTVIGFCGLVHPHGQLEAEIKYALRREFWGQGFATEAAEGLLRYGAREYGLRHVIATAAPENTISHQVLLKAGMVKSELRQNDDHSFTQLFVWPPPANENAL